MYVCFRVLASKYKKNLITSILNQLQSFGIFLPVGCFSSKPDFIDKASNGVTQPEELVALHSSVFFFQ